MDKRITIEMAARRIGTIRRTLADQSLPEQPMHAEIDGRRLSLTERSFQIDDDGTLIIHTGLKRLPLSIAPLNEDEVFRLDTRITNLLDYLREPGDWGYDTALGRLTEVLHVLRTEIRSALISEALPTQRNHEE